MMDEEAMKIKERELNQSEAGDGSTELTTRIPEGWKQEVLER